MPAENQAHSARVTNATEPVSVSARTTAIVVGGSLTGLAAAIALGHSGVAVTVLERSTRLMTEFGAGLGIDLDLLGSLVPAQVATLPVVGPGRLSTSWLSLYQLLRSTAQASPLVAYRQAARVIEVSDAAGQATATLDSGETLQADLIIGADGYRSLVRRFVDPGHPDAEYAGNLLWRGVLDEHDVPPHAVHETLDAGLAVHRSHGRYLVTYPLPDLQGRTGRGRRRLNWGWYWRSPADRFPWSTDAPPRTIRVDELDHSIADAVARAAAIWPEPWPELISFTARRRRMFATPIFDYRPRRLVNGHLMILGDAAHVTSPMAGAGLANGLLDALELGSRITGETVDVRSALAAYERNRLRPAQSLVDYGSAWSARFRTGPTSENLLGRQ